jgi:cardiolipin synthase
MHWSHLVTTVPYVIAIAVAMMRAMLRPNRDPASRIAWVLVILIVPVIGVIAYLLLGEARVSRSRRARGIAIDEKLPRPPGDPEAERHLAESYYFAPFALAGSINKLPPVGGNSATLAHDSNAAVDGMVADIDAATDTAHVCFYIWLADNNGLKLQQTLVRAAQRGVTVRVLADALGSRTFIRSPHWQELKDAGAEVRVALPVGNPLWTMIRGRVDLRNHRKAVIIDNRIAWCGSQNAADPEFRIKPKFAPWVDILTRWEGPIARDWQYLFVSDWMGEHGEDISGLLTAAPSPSAGGSIIAQAIGTGPTLPFGAMPACFCELMYAARHELVITTPYFVPNEALMFALASAAVRGVRTIIIFPEHNDSRVVGGASRSNYPELLACGVEIHEYPLGLLHAKTLVVDGEIALIGSANLDRRSFDLNFENNILFMDRDFAKCIRARQDEWLAVSKRVTAQQVAAYSLSARLWQNLMAMFSPLI